MPRLPLCLLLLAGCDPAPDVASPDERVTVTLGTSPRRGPATARVVIVEFADYECSYCRSAQTTVAQVLVAYPADVAVVFKHFPLAFHGNARLAAEAAAVAAGSGRFWEMHQILFDHQGALDRGHLDGYASSAGLDPAAFAAALDAGEGAAVVDADVGQARALAVSATPTFYFNGRRMVGAQSFAAFAAVIDEELSL